MELDPAEIEQITESLDYIRCIEISQQYALENNKAGHTKPPKLVNNALVEFYSSSDFSVKSPMDGTPGAETFGKWLTNCYPTRITVDGVIYVSSEHYFQISKFVINEDDPNVIAWCKEHKIKPAAQIANNATLRSHLATLTTVAVAKSGRTRHAPIRGDWEEIKCAVMYRALMAKFSQDPICAAKLRQTGARVLIERSPSDSCWAINNRGIGKNMLGVLLMIVRSMIE